MTTREFIKKYFEGSTQKEYCSSVYGAGKYTDQKTVYSYGSHYPLATIINGKGYVNNRGYSMTTAKHINWAHSALADLLGWDNVYSVPLIPGEILTEHGIKESVKQNLKVLTGVMATKKRKNTFVYADLERQVKAHREIEKSIKADGPAPGPESDGLAHLKTVSNVMALGDIFGKDQKESNDWKARMLKAGLEGRGLIMPEDWDTLTEDEKEARLNGAIKQLS